MDIQSPFQIRSENREKYFRIQRKNILEFKKSVDRRSTPDSDFLEELPKSGKKFVLCWKSFLEAYDRRILQQKIFYSTAGDVTWSLEEED